MKKIVCLFLILLLSSSLAFAQNGPAAQVKSKVKWADVEETPVDLAGYGITDAVTSEDLPTNASFTLAELGEKDFSSLTNKPTTLAGYGIKDNAAFEANGQTIFAFNSNGIEFWDYSYSINGCKMQAFMYQDMGGSSLMYCDGATVKFSSGHATRNKMEFYPIGTGEIISGTPVFTINGSGVQVNGVETVSIGGDCMRKTVRVQLNSAAKVSLMSLLNTQFMPCGELRVVCNTTNAAINVVLNGSNSVTMQYGTTSAAADEASKLCVYYDGNDFDYYLKNNLLGTRTFIVEYLGRN